MSRFFKSDIQFSKYFLINQVQKVAELLKINLTHETVQIIAPPLDKSNKKNYHKYFKFQEISNIPEMVFFTKLSYKSLLDTLPIIKAAYNKFINQNNINPFNPQVDLTRPTVINKASTNQDMRQNIDKYKEEYYKMLNPAPQFNGGNLIDPNTGKPKVGPEIFLDNEQPPQRGNFQPTGSNNFQPSEQGSFSTPGISNKEPVGNNSDISQVFSGYSSLDAIQGNGVQIYESLDNLNKPLGQLHNGTNGPNMNDPRLNKRTLDQYQAERNQGINVPNNQSSFFDDRICRKRRRQIKRLQKCAITDICPQLQDPVICNSVDKFIESIAPLTIEQLETIAKKTNPELFFINLKLKNKEIKNFPKKIKASELKIFPAMKPETIQITDNNNLIQINDQIEHVPNNNYSYSQLINEINNIIYEMDVVLLVREKGQFQLINSRSGQLEDSETNDYKTDNQLSNHIFTVTNPDNSVFRLLDFYQDTYTGSSVYDNEQLKAAISFNNYPKKLIVDLDKPTTCTLDPVINIKTIKWELIAQSNTENKEQNCIKLSIPYQIKIKIL